MVKDGHKIILEIGKK
ncbi:hypothetical protein OL548_23185 [Lysinibacillus sp. MHQ-1]|nr:hypothetical protein OL548_23185 [Lysinibacillus sp. MHQ-1]